MKDYVTSKFKDIPLLIYGLTVWLIGYFVPPVNGRWTFGAIRGGKYIDNTRHLFELLSVKDCLDCAWITRKEEVAQQVRSLGHKAHSFYSIKGLWHVITSEVAFFTHRGNLRNGDLPFYAMNNKTFRVQTWHGIPLKKIGYDDKIFSYTIDESSNRYRVRCFLESLFPYLQYVKQPDLVLALSEETREIFSGSFRVSLENVAITGYPRNDRLLSGVSSQESLKKIIYMPTFRGAEGKDFDPLTQYGFDLAEFEQALQRNNCSFYIKVHPFNLPSEDMLKSIEQSQRISFLWDEDIYYTLNQFDVLVTDYSSVYFDFLLLGKPIIFTPFDHSDYIANDRELYFDYNDVTPGPKATTWGEFLEIVNNIDDFYENYVESARALKNRFHTYGDASSAERVYESVLKRLKR